MTDINGTEIEVGDVVRTKQPTGGFMTPAPSQTGVVEETTDAFGKDTMQIKYRLHGKEYDQYILLGGKINEVIFRKPNKETEK